MVVIHCSVFPGLRGMRTKAFILLYAEEPRDDRTDYRQRGLLQILDGLDFELDSHKARTPAKNGSGADSTPPQHTTHLNALRKRLHPPQLTQPLTCHDGLICSRSLRGAYLLLPGRTLPTCLILISRGQGMAPPR